MAIHVTTNFIKRNIDKISPFEIKSRTSRCDVLFSVSGKTGVGKTTYVKKALEQMGSKNATSVIILDKLEPLSGCDELVSMVIGNYNGLGRLHNLKLFADSIQYIKRLGLFEFVSMVGPRPAINIEKISDVFVRDFSDHKNLWVVLDHFSSGDRLILDWVKLILKNKTRRFSLRLICVVSDSESIYREFDLQNQDIIIPEFSNVECKEFYEKSVNAFNALGNLSFQSALIIVKNNPLWLQWLAHCPKSWMMLDKDIVSLNDTILSFVSTKKQKTFLAHITLSYHLDQYILKEIIRTTGIVDDGWIISDGIREHSDTGNLALHHSIRNQIINDIRSGYAPDSEASYHESLYKIMLELSKDWALSDGKYPEKSSIETTKSFFYHGTKNNETKNIVDKLRVRILLKFVVSNFGRLIELFPEPDDPQKINLEIFYKHLWHREFSDARKQWEVFFLSVDLYNDNMRSSFLAILGFLCFLEDKYDDAIRVFQDAISLNPNNGIAFLGRGLLLQDKKQKDSALRDISNAVESDPSLSVAYNERGALYLSLGLPEQALDDFKSALQSNPYYVHAMVNLGVLYFQLQDHDQAKFWLSRAMQTNRNEADAYISLMKIKVNAKSLLN
jgi:tetratricopeptide (TPR) repeat protein